VRATAPVHFFRLPSPRFLVSNLTEGLPWQESLRPRGAIQPRGLKVRLAPAKLSPGHLREIAIFTENIGRRRFTGMMRATRSALVAAIVACTATSAEAGVVPLGTAENFAVLGGSTVTNTGPSILSGDLGVSSGTSITGFPPGIVNGGTTHAGNAVAAQAHSDATAAYLMLAALPVTRDLTGQDLGGLTLTPGVYRFSSSAQLTGRLTFDGQGQADPLFVFQIGSTLTTASGSSIVTINGADACDAFFQIGSSATLGTGTRFSGTLIAYASDTLTTGASVDGRVIALNGAVTLDTNDISSSHCNATAVPLPPGAYAGLVGLLLIIAGTRVRQRLAVFA
jgi:Ice-binding-like